MSTCLQVTLGAADAVLDSLGLDTTIRERRADKCLSGGKRQQVAPWTSDCASPEILLLDEPGTGIDRVRKLQFFTGLRLLSRGSDGSPTTL